jgi:Na+-driven multidrug efflux pump
LVAFACYYIIGVPLAGFLAFKTNMGLKGTWIGIAVGSFFVNISFGLLIKKAKWKAISQ